MGAIYFVFFLGAWRSLSIRTQSLTAVWSSVLVLPSLCPSVNSTLEHVVTKWQTESLLKAQQFAESVQSILGILDCSYPGQGDTCRTTGNPKDPGKVAWWCKPVPALECRGSSDFKAVLVYIVDLRPARAT